MNKLLLFVALATLSFSFIVVNTNFDNTDGGWTKTEKDSFMKSCTDKLDGTEGINAEAYCSCMLTKIMKKYPSPTDALNIDQDWMKSEATKCLGSTEKDDKKKPKKKKQSKNATWAKEYQDNFLTTCIESSKGEASIDGPSYCNCMLEKIMVKYPNPNNLEEMDEDWMVKEAAKCLGL